MDTVYLVLRVLHEDENSILGAFATRELAEEYQSAITVCEGDGEVTSYVYEMPLVNRPICG